MLSNYTTNNTNNTTPIPIPSTINVTTEMPIIIKSNCHEPWSYVPENSMQTLWRIVYWTSQVLTWIILPLMQSFSMAGDFNFTGKLKSALIENTIYYGSFAGIFLVLLIYVAIKVGIDWSGVKIICITASNTWGLFLLVVLLGYGLVEIPRSAFNTSQYHRTLSYFYFKVAKLSAEKCEADEKLDDILDEIQGATESLSGQYDPYRPYIEVILEKCPPEWAQQIRTRILDGSGYTAARGNAYNEKSFVRMHQTLNRAMQTHRRTHNQWDYLIKKAIEWEDVAKNELNHLPIYKSSLSSKESTSQLTNLIRNYIYTPKIEWYWKCVVRGPTFRVLSYVLAAFSVMVIWSEITFSIESIPLSIFALLFKGFGSHYFLIEVSDFELNEYFC